MNTLETSLLGKVATYADLYDAALLYPLPRAAQREQIGVTDHPIFLGADLWTAYELSWLNARGKPQVALGRFTVPSESTYLVESKSLKLYLNSFNNTVFADIDAVRQTLQKDLSEAVWRGGVVKSSVGVQLMSPEQYTKEKITEMDGLSLDRLDLDCSHYQPAPELLSTAYNEAPVTETL
ncbi:MAG: NADPH-dependent 7-cyano-7-deazaguanine reductase QueF, partial [Betaproteobacteria bacterium]|nr:NADPH-dependent 7-cyano-7-deazaguanine reductase QueF [Betaproteobacteria bacterium]